MRSKYYRSRPKHKTTVHLHRAIQRKIKADRRESASSLKAVIETEFEIIICKQTVRHRLHEAAFKGCVAKQKPYVDKTNRMKRIQYAKKYREQPLCFWDQVLWTNESKFNLFGSDGKVMVWRTPKEAFDPRCTALTVKHGRENVKC